MPVAPFVNGPPIGRAVTLNRASPLANGLVFSWLAGAGNIDHVNRRAVTLSGTRRRGARRQVGVARGFGSTYGAGASDYVLTSFSNHASQRSYAFWMLYNGTGGANLGRVFDKRSPTPAAAFGPEAVLHTGGVLRYDRTFNSAASQGQWGITMPSAGVWAFIVITYDSSSISNDATFYRDGAAVALVADTNPASGNADITTDVYALGNRPNDGARNWDGMIASFSIWDRILSAAEVRSLYDPQTRWQLFRPVSPWKIIASAPASGVNATMTGDVMTASALSPAGAFTAASQMTGDMMAASALSPAGTVTAASVMTGAAMGATALSPAAVLTSGGVMVGELMAAVASSPAASMVASSVMQAASMAASALMHAGTFSNGVVAGAARTVLARARTFTAAARTRVTTFLARAQP